MLNRPLSRFLPACLFFSLLLSGCGPKEDEGIQKYSVSKEDVGSKENRVKPTGGTNPHRPVLPQKSGKTVKARILGAILPTSNLTWFFKLKGPDAAVKAESVKFDEFLKSVKIERGRPVWGKLPNGWKLSPKTSAMRLATILVNPAAGSLELSVIFLKSPQDVLSNVNRWRGQVSLPGIGGEQLYSQDGAGGEVTKTKIAGLSAIKVVLVGEMVEGGTRPPFFR